MPGYVVREGRFFSIVHNGPRYPHSADATTAANASGNITLPITPMLRIRPANGAVCEFRDPKIEGFLTGNSVAWTFTRAKTTPPTFVIKEVE